MQLRERSYSGQVFRPKPLIDADSKPGTVIIATSWGAPEHATKVVQKVNDFLSLAAEPDATAMGSYIEGLGTQANRLRSAALLANETLFSNENRAEYLAGVELTAFVIHNNSLSWVQVGTPHLLLSTRKGLQPLSYSPDWAWQLGSDSPLLCHGLGLEPHCQVQCGSVKVESMDKVILVSRSSIPGIFYSQEKLELSDLSQVLVEDSPDTPFWLGILDL